MANDGLCMVSKLEPALLPMDGRQSQAALDVARGTRRLLQRMGAASLTEVPLANGRRADIVALSRKRELWIVEIKSSVADFRADQKWPDYQAFCDRLYFAVAADFPVGLIPETAGLIMADRFGAEVLREPPEQKLQGARRASVIAHLARLGAQRLHALADPQAGLAREDGFDG